MVANVVAVSIPGAPTSTYAPVQNLADLILYAQNGKLRAVNSTPALTTLSNTTGPDGWQGAGNDSSNAYVYLNSSTASSGTGTWQVLSVTRGATQTVATLGTGTDSILVAYTRPGAIYATVLSGSSSSSVIRIATVGGAQSTYIAPSTAVSFVGTNSNGYNVVTTYSSANGYSAQIINNAEQVLYSIGNGILFGADQTQFDTISNSYVPSGLVFASPLGSKGYGGASVLRFDLASLSSRTLGLLPTGDSLGGLSTDVVYAGGVLPSQGFGGLLTARLVSSQVQSNGSAVYTYNTGVANSLTRTTSQVR